MTNFATISNDLLDTVTGGSTPSPSPSSHPTTTTRSGGSCGGNDALAATLQSLQSSLASLTSNNGNNSNQMLTYMMIGLMLARRNDVYVYDGGGGYGGYGGYGGGWGGGYGFHGGCKGW